MKKPTKTKAKAVTVTLIKAHRHRGKDRAPDEQIEVTEAQRSWLLELKVIAADSAT